MAIAIQYKKCLVLHFGAINPKINYAMDYKEIQVYIDNLSFESDLVVIFGCNLLFDNHIGKAMKKANQTLGIVIGALTFLNNSVLISRCKA